MMVYTKSSNYNIWIYFTSVKYTEYHSSILHQINLIVYIKNNEANIFGYIYIYI